MFPKQHIFLFILSFQPLGLSLSQSLLEPIHYATADPTGIEREEQTNLTQSSLTGRPTSRRALLRGASGEKEQTPWNTAATSCHQA